MYLNHMGYFSSNFISHFLILSGIILFVFLIGHLLLLPFKQEKDYSFFNFFYKSLTGTVFLVTVYSVLMTHGKTVNFLFIVIAGFLIFRMKPELERFSPDNIKHTGVSKIQWCVVFCLSSFIYTYIAYFTIPSQENLIPSYFFDTVFYSKIIDYLNLTGYENTFQEANILDPSFHGVSSYHYFELWFTAFVVRVFGTLSLLSFKIISVPFFILLIMTGMLSLLECVKKIEWKDALIITGFLFFAGIQWAYFDRFEFIYRLSSSHKYPMAGTMALPKVLAITLFLLLTLILIKKDKKHIAFYPLLCLPVLNIATLPGVFGGIVLWLFINYFFKQDSNEKKPWTPIAEVFLVFSGMVMVFFFFKPDIDYVGINLADIIENNFKNLYPEKVNYVAGILIAHAVYFLPFFLFLIIRLVPLIRFVSKNKQASQISFLFLLMLAISLTIIVLLSGLPDFYQFYQNIFIASFYVLFFTVYVFLTEFKRKERYLFLIMVISFSIYNFCLDVSLRKEQKIPKYSSAYIEEIRKSIPQIRNPLGACIYTEKDSVNGPTTHNKLGYYLKMMKNDYNTVNLATHYLYNNAQSSQTASALKFQGFNYFALNKIKKEKNVVTESELMELFMQQYKIEFLIIDSKDTLPSFIKPKIVKLIKDDKTGEQFCLLKAY